VADEGAIVSGMAGRYATALFELAREQNAIDTVKVNLERFDAMVAEIADLARLLRSPVLSADEQKRALSGVLDKVGIDGIAANFLKLVATNRRLFAARDMVKAYRALVAKHKGEVTAEVTVAEKPSEAHLAAIKETITAMTKKHVQMDVKVDPSIIGGLVSWAIWGSDTRGFQPGGILLSIIGAILVLWIWRMTRSRTTV